MREFCRIKLANVQVKIQEPVTQDSEDLQHLSPESITKLVWGFAQAIPLRHINKVFYFMLFYQVQVNRHSNNLFCPYSVHQGTN